MSNDPTHGDVSNYWPDTPAPGWLTDEERRASLATTMADRPPGPVWIFAYGSLLWKPAFRHVEQQVGTLRGYHRRFCLVVKRFRGTDEAPGLMLSLDRGGLCKGALLRLDAATEEEDLRALWQREIVSAAYNPRWSRITTQTGETTAIAFVANRRHERYLRPGSDDEAATMISRARGPVGSCAEYLHETHAHLLSLGINDRGLARLDRLVKEKMSARA